MVIIIIFIIITVIMTINNDNNNNSNNNDNNNTLQDATLPTSRGSSPTTSSVGVHVRAVGWPTTGSPSTNLNSSY